MLAQALFLVLSAPQTAPSLLKASRPLLKIRGWQEGQLTVGMHLWWSPTHVLAFVGETRQILVDVQRGTSKPFSAPAVHRSFWGVSPDRSKVVSQSWKGRQIAWKVTDPSGRRAFGSWSIRSRTPRPHKGGDYGHPSPNVQWSADGRSLYQIEYWPTKAGFAAQVTERPLTRLSKPRPFPVVDGLPWATGLEVFAGKALCSTYQLGNGKRLRLREWSLSSPRKTTRAWTVFAPKGHRILDRIPSPDRKRTAWIMGRPGPAPLVDNGYPHAAISLWTSGPQGESMTEIGEIDFRSSDDDWLMDRYQHFGEVQWNPDGRHVSFVYDRVLYGTDVRKAPERPTNFKRSDAARGAPPRRSGAGPARSPLRKDKAGPGSTSARSRTRPSR